MPRDILYRQPFPGPGLAIRCLGEVTAGALACCAPPTHIVTEEIRDGGALNEIWQSFSVLLPVAASA